jgi:hypothetical protein
MNEQVWRDGLPAGAQDFTDFKYQTMHWRIDDGPTISLEIEPTDSIGPAGRSGRRQRGTVRVFGMSYGSANGVACAHVRALRPNVLRHWDDPADRAAPRSGTSTL